MPTLAGRALKLPKPRWPDNGGALGLGFKLGSDFIWTIIGHVTAQYWLVTTSIHRTNRVSANAGMLAEARRALPWHHPEHGHHVRQGHMRGVHARQHALRRNAARSAQSTSHMIPIFPYLDDPDTVRQHPDHRHSLAGQTRAVHAALRV